MNLGTKLVTTMVGSAILVVATAGLVAYELAASALERSSFDALTSLRDDKRVAVETFFDQLRANALFLAEDEATWRTLTEFAAALDEGESSCPEPRLAGAAGLERSGPILEEEGIAQHSSTEYVCVRSRHHDGLRRFVDFFGVSNVMLIGSEDLRVLYSVDDRVPIGAALGRLAPDERGFPSPLLLQTLERARGAVDVGAVIYSDLEMGPAGDATFTVAAPILRDGAMQGLVALCCPATRLHALMSDQEGRYDDRLGNSRVSWVVGADGRVRSSSRMHRRSDAEVDEAALSLFGSKPLEDRIESAATRSATAGFADTLVVTDHRGEEVLSSFSPLVLSDLSWSILSEIDADESRAPIHALGRRLAALAIGLGLAVAGVAAFFATTIVQPLRSLARHTAQVGSGSPVERVDITSRDEIGGLANAFNAMIERLEETTVSKDYVEGIVSSMINPVAVIETKGRGTKTLHDAVIRSINPAFVRMLGGREQDYVGGALDSVVIEADARWLREAIEGRPVSAGEQHVRTCEGESIPALFTAARIATDGVDSTRIVWVGQDLREHLHAEEAMREQDRMKGDLAVARRIQQNLLPSAPPKLPGYDFASWAEPAHETGGDHHDWITTPDGRLFVMVADATGHGIGPALLLADCRAYIRCAINRGDDVEEIARTVNDLMAGDMPTGWFITASMATLDPRSHSMRCFSAGHPSLCICRAAQEKIERIDSDTIPLGLLKGEVHGTARTIDLAPNDVAVLWTDGFFEWANRDGEHYGVERLEATVLRHRAEPASRLITRIRQDLLAFVGSTTQPDDMTIVVIKRTA